MAYEINNYAVKVTLVAASSLATAQYKFVKLDADGQAVICAAATDIPIGVLQNSPGAGEECEVLVIGGTKLIAAGAIDEGAVIGTDSSALADPKTPGTDTTNYVVGVALTASGGANNVFTALINCASPARAA